MSFPPEVFFKSLIEINQIFYQAAVVLVHSGSHSTNIAIRHRVEWRKMCLKICWALLVNWVQLGVCLGTLAAVVVCYLAITHTVSQIKFYVMLWNTVSLQLQSATQIQI